ncbi:MAG: ATP-binding protein [Caldilineaceae bacterium]
MSTPVTAYQVRHLRSQAAKVRGIEGLRAELVGRQEEMTKLHAALTQAQQGDGQIVAIVGSAGVGKSRLVEELKLMVDRVWKGAGAGSRGKGLGARSRGWEQGAGGWEQGAGAGSKGQGAGSRGQGAGSKGQGAGSRGQGVGAMLWDTPHSAFRTPHSSGLRGGRSNSPAPPAIGCLPIFCAGSGARPMMSMTGVWSRICSIHYRRCRTPVI